MSSDLYGEITAIATTVLAVFAILTGIYAIRAFRKQSQEVRAIEQQVTDQRELTRQQGEILKVQSGQLELQRTQLDEQRQVNARQAEVLALQADDLRESLAGRKREADLRHRDQASRVFIAEETYDTNPEGRPATDVSPPSVTAVVSNTSDQPIYEAALCWHLWTAG